MKKKIITLVLQCNKDKMKEDEKENGVIFM